MKQKGTLHLLTLGLHVTQNKFVTRILFIFHKPLMIPTIPAEWLIHVDLIQKLPMFVSQHDILIGLSELNEGSTYQVIKA